jgi:hypothetical protein
MSTYTIRAIYLGYNGWAKYCPFEKTTVDNIQQVIDMIDEAEELDLYLGRDPVWMVAVYTDEDKAPVAIKTPLGWQVK